MKLSLVLQAIDKASPVIRKVTGAQRDMTARGLNPMAQAMATVDRANSRVAASTFRWMRPVLRGADALDRGTRAARQFAGPMGIGAIDLAARGAGRSVAWLGRTAGNFALGMAKWGAIGAAGAAAYGAGWLTSGVISQASKFEQFQVILENTEGSAEKARKAMDWVKVFAEKTPYELGEVMEAFVQMKGYGIDAMDGTLEAAGNMAAGMGKPLMQAVEALADAQTGEFERLKGFSINAAQHGDKVTFSYRKNGKEITKTVAKTGTAIQQAFREISDDRFAGMMNRQSSTLLGIWRNLMDKLANFQLDVGNGGFFDVVKSKLGALLDWVNAKGKDGTLKRWAEEISDRLTDMTKRAAAFVEGTDWGAVASGVGSVASALVKVLELLGKIIALAKSMPRSPLWLGVPGGSHNSFQGIPTDALGVMERANASRRAQWDANRKFLDRSPKASPAAWTRGLQTGKPALGTGRGPLSPPQKVKVDIELKGAGAKDARTRVSSSSKTTSVDIWSGYRGTAMGGPR